MKVSPLGRVLAACSVLLVMLVACSNSSTPRAALANGCYVNSDCNSPLVCAFQRCHTECMTSRDCPGGAICVASDRPFHVCQLGVEKNCAYNSDCPIGQVCGVDQNCRDQCKTSSDCVPGEVCTQGTCADPDQLEGGRLPVVVSDASPPTVGDDGSTVPTGQSCVYNSDCASGLICLNQACVPECKQDVDCLFKGAGYQCAGGQCVVALVEAGTQSGAPDATVDSGAACIYNSDCQAPEICIYGACVPQCREDRDCAPGQTCVNAACVGSTAEASTDATSGPLCVYNSDCPSPKVCISGACVPQCRQDRDCASGETCVNAVCFLPEASVSNKPDATSDAGGCAYNSDCSPQICSNGVCIDQCHADVDCPGGETCSTSHVCVTPEASIPVNAPDGYGGGCIYNSDCPVPLVCKSNGSCGYQCLSNLDCTSGSYCSAAHQCIAGSPPQVDSGTVDSGSDAAAADAGKLCTYNSDCSDGLWCNGIEQCVNSHCAPATDTPCNTHSTCVTSTCNEQAQTCSYTTLGSMDADGDGHFDTACGGDDCNDFDPTVYTGHPELCDGKDNDCNGLVDDYAVVARGSEYTSVGTTGTETFLTTSAFGSGFLTGKWTTNATTGNGIDVQTMTTGGAVGTDPEIVHPGAYNAYSSLVAVAGSPVASPSALFVYNLDVGQTQSGVPRYAMVVTPSAADGGTGYTTSTPITLVPTGVYYTSLWTGSDDADVHWTGSGFLLAWTYYGSYSATGFFTTINPDGTQATSNNVVPTPPGPDGGSPTGVLGNPVSGGPLKLRSAANGSLYGFIYGQWSAPASTGQSIVYLTSASGSVVGGPVILPSAPLSIAPFKAGFVALTQDANALIMTQISSTGTVLAQSRQTALGAGSLMATDARGAQDAQGVEFAVLVPGGMRMVRTRGTLSDPMEVTTPITPTAAGSGDRIGLSLLADGTVGLSYWESASAGAVHVRIVSCLP